MNELLAPLLHVVHKSATAASDQQLLDEQYLEHDTFALFQAVMHRMGKYYAVPETIGSKEESAKSYLIKTSETIQTEQLKLIDSRLAKHLANIGLEGQVYGM